MTPQEEWLKKAKRLLTDPDGRAALKAYGFDVELVTDEKQLKEKPIVVVLCPSYRAPEPQMRDSLNAMVEYTRKHDIATIYSGPVMGGSVVHWSRNGLIQEHLKSGKPWTHALFIDDDMVLAPDTLEKLLSHKKDIVAGLCTRRNDPPVPNIRFYDKSTGATKQIWEWPEGKLIEVDAAGTAVMLLTQNALEQVAQCYFDCLWEQKFYGLSGEKLERLKKVRLDKFDEDKLCYWFRFLPTDHGDIEMGEDIAFCMLAKEFCDIPVFVDTAVQPGHIGNYAYGIKDFAPYRDDCILRAKILGEYPMEIPPMKISILCPTRGRPDRMREMTVSVNETCSLNRAAGPPEIVFYIDDDDHASIECAKDLKSRMWNVKSIIGPRILMTQMWNKCAQAAEGEILVLSGDDVLFKTKGWDVQVRRAFAAFPDRLVLVHGDDGVWGNKFGTHCFLHRAWVDAVGYFSPPYFSSDYGDTWINDVFNALNRRIYLPFVTEHLHPAAGKAEWDKTHTERLERHKQDNTPKLYAELAGKREEDIRKVQARLGIPWEARVAEYA